MNAKRDFISLEMMEQMRQRLRPYILENMERTEEGNVVTETRYKYYLQLDGLTECEAQRLALGVNGFAWYKEKEIDREFNFNSGRIKLYKELVDESGNKVTDTDKVLKFKVTVNGEEEILNVKPGEYTYSKLYTWGQNEKAPEYKVEEIKEETKEVIAFSKVAKKNVQIEVTHGGIHIWL